MFIIRSMQNFCIINALSYPSDKLYVTLIADFGCCIKIKLKQNITRINRIKFTFYSNWDLSFIAQALY